MLHDTAELLMHTRFMNLTNWLYFIPATDSLLHSSIQHVRQILVYFVNLWTYYLTENMYLNKIHEHTITNPQYILTIDNTSSFLKWFLLIFAQATKYRWIRSYKEQFKDTSKQRYRRLISQFSVCRGNSYLFVSFHLKCIRSNFIFVSHAL